MRFWLSFVWRWIQTFFISYHLFLFSFLQMRGITWKKFTMYILLCCNSKTHSFFLSQSGISTITFMFDDLVIRHYWWDLLVRYIPLLIGLDFRRSVITLSQLNWCCFFQFSSYVLAFTTLGIIPLATLSRGTFTKICGQSLSDSLTCTELYLVLHLIQEGWGINLCISIIYR